MKSKAAVGNHPLHPAFVVLPIGAWFSSLVGDIAYQTTANSFWYEFAYYTMWIGVISALVAAVFGFIDYFGVQMSEAGRRVATTHMLLNLSVVVAYLINLWLRADQAALVGGRWTLAFVLQILSFGTLGISGWLGGKMSYEHKIGVAEHADPEATRIGMDEAAEPGRVPARQRGLQG